MIDQPPAHGGRCIHWLATGHHVERVFHTDLPWQPLGAARSRQQPQLDLRQTQFRTARRYPVVTAQRGFQAATQRGAVNCSDRQFTEFIQLRENFPQRWALRRFAEFRDIGAGDKCPPGAVNNYCLDRSVTTRISKTIANAFAHGLRQRVDGWVVDGNDCDPTMPGQRDCFAHPV